MLFGETLFVVGKWVLGLRREPRGNARGAELHVPEESPGRSSK
jgi:hypothetical protein